MHSLKPAALGRFATVLGTLLFAAPVGAQEDEVPEGYHYTGRAFVFEADPEFGRAAGWVGDELTSEAMLERIRTAVAKRLRRTGRYVEARVLAEENDRLAVVFVGAQDERIENFLIAGLTNPGRFAYRVLAQDADVDGSSLEEERARLEAWRESNPDKPLIWFSAVTRTDGGPHPALDWRLERRGDADAPLPLLRGEVQLVEHEDMAPSTLRAIGVGDSTFGIQFELGEQAGKRVDRFAKEHASRTLAIVLNGRVVRTETPEQTAKSPVELDLSFSLEETRELLFALAGRSLPTRLRFVEFSKRVLSSVVEKGCQ